MAQRIQGCEDLFGEAMEAWTYAQHTAHKIFDTYAFDMIETPALEQVATFVHGIGESTDVVRKEMFRVYSGALLDTLLSTGSEESLRPRQRMALRPEGTAGVVRAVVEHNLCAPGTADYKVWYAEAMFRGERPQKGRLRQFHQIGCEWLGAEDPCADAEVIMLLMGFYERMGFDPSDLVLRLNSMGDSACRPEYRELVRNFINDHADEMCEDCLERARINPLRAFDCKNESCHQVMQACPLAKDHLCDACKHHYEEVKRTLDAQGVSYVEDPTLVRGLDYYTRTVFEVECPRSAVGAIGGGGRYDGLVELEGGKPTSGLGWALGFERMILALKDLGKTPWIRTSFSVYVAYASEHERLYAARACQLLRKHGIRTYSNYQGRSLKSQFKQADKLGVALCVVVGEEEALHEEVTLRDMSSHEQTTLPLSELASAVDKAKAEKAQA